MAADVGDEILGRLISSVEHDDHVDRIALDLVRQTDRGALGDGRVGADGSFDLGGADAMTGHLDDVVGTTNDPDVTVLVDTGRVTSEVDPRILRPVGVEVTVGILVESTHHGGPRVLEDQEALLAGGQFVALLVHDISLLTENRSTSGAGFERHGGNRGDLEHAGLGLPPSVGDRARAVADDVVEPTPGLRIDRLADRAEHAQAGQVVLAYPGLAEAHQGTDGGRSGVEARDAIVLDELPPAVGVRIGRAAFMHEDGGSVEQRSVDEVGVTGDPARVGRAPPAVLLLDVEALFEGGIGTNLVAAVSVDDGLRFTGRARGVEDEQRVLGVHLDGLALSLGNRQLAQLVIPVVPGGVHGDVRLGVAHHDDVLHGR